jgi:hypothetical protein
MPLRWRWESDYPDAPTNVILVYNTSYQYNTQSCIYILCVHTHEEHQKAHNMNVMTIPLSIHVIFLRKQEINFNCMRYWESKKKMLKWIGFPLYWSSTTYFACISNQALSVALQANNTLCKMWDMDFIKSYVSYIYIYNCNAVAIH